MYVLKHIIQLLTCNHYDFILKPSGSVSEVCGLQAEKSGQVLHINEKNAAQLLTAVGK